MGVLVHMERLVIRLLRRMPLRYFRFAMKFWAISSGRRVGSLAADTAFWGVFSLPWLILAFASTVGLIVRVAGPGVDDAIRSDIEQALIQLVGGDVAHQYAIPAFEQMFNEGLRGLGVVGYVVAFYSGSRAVRGFVESVRLVSGASERQQFRSRFRALGLYLVGVLLIVFAFSTVTVGTDELADITGLGEWIFQILDILLLLLRRHCLHVDDLPLFDTSSVAVAQRRASRHRDADSWRNVHSSRRVVRGGSCESQFNWRTCRGSVRRDVGGVCCRQRGAVPGDSERHHQRPRRLRLRFRTPAALPRPAANRSGRSRAPCDTGGNVHNQNGTLVPQIRDPAGTNLGSNAGR